LPFGDGAIDEEAMRHAGVYALASVGIVTMASACASRHNADASAPIVESRSIEATNASLPASTAESGGASDSDDELTPASGPAERGEAASDCPMQMREAELSALPAMGGVAFVFTTQNPSALDELRRRALALHDAYVRGLRPAAGTANDPATRTAIETSVDYVDERDGARIEVRAIHQSDVDELRGRLQSDIKAMTDQRVCPALRGSSAAARGATSP
jgi:hypothetical protein